MICTNDDCPAKLERRIINFVGRDAMDIKGFGEEYIRTLIENGYLHDIADIYLLKDYRQELIEKGLIGKEKGTDNVLNAIEASKSNEPFRLLTGLSIPNVGKTSSKTIMKAFNSIDDLMHARVDQLVEVQDVGETTALCIHDFFHKDSNIRLLERLKEYGLTFDMEVVESSSELAGQTYVITGSLEKFANRDAMVAFIESHGGSVSGSVSKKTFALINNDIASNSGKNKKAKELGIPIITEEEFLSKVQS